MKKFPTTLYVKRMKDGETEYFSVDTDPIALVEMGESIELGVYKLQHRIKARGDIKIESKLK